MEAPYGMEHLTSYTGIKEHLEGARQVPPFLHEKLRTNCSCGKPRKNLLLIMLCLHLSSQTPVIPPPTRGALE